MKKCRFSEYAKVSKLLSPSACGAIYPRSVLEGIQPGDVYTDGSAGLIWHYSGFAFLCGEITQSLLHTVYSQFLQPNAEQPRRFLLFSEQTDVTAFFAQQPNLLIEQRQFFSFAGTPQPPALPSGTQLAEIDSTLLRSLCGRITPSFSWENADSFLQNGKGYCVTVDGAPAAWAFSAAVSAEEIDIGVETGEAFRRKGYARAAVSAMIEYIIAQHKKPVWACHAQNAASGRLAESVGFVQTAECCTVRRT